LDEDADIDVASLRGGAVGIAAIYTEKSRASHLIRRIMIRKGGLDELHHSVVNRPHSRRA